MISSVQYLLLESRTGNPPPLTIHPLTDLERESTVGASDQLKPSLIRSGSTSDNTRAIIQGYMGRSDGNQVDTETKKVLRSLSQKLGLSL